MRGSTLPPSEGGACRIDDHWWGGALGGGTQLRLAAEFRGLAHCRVLYWFLGNVNHPWPGRWWLSLAAYLATTRFLVALQFGHLQGAAAQESARFHGSRKAARDGWGSGVRRDSWRGRR